MRELSTYHFKHVLIDGNNLAWRMHWIYKNVYKDNRITRGLVRMLGLLKKKLLSPTFHLVLDGGYGGKEQISEDYKSKRRQDKSDMRVEIEEELKTLLGRFVSVVRTYQVLGYEADEVIATLVNQFEEAGERSVIYSGDRDFFALVSDHTKVLRPEKGVTWGVVYDIKRVEESFGVHPQDWLVYRALVGDTSDNIKGFPKMWKKVAAVISKGAKDFPGVLRRAALQYPKWYDKLLGWDMRFEENMQLLQFRKVDMKATKSFHTKWEHFKAFGTELCIPYEELKRMRWLGR